ncbi:alfa-L-rhamnosidase [Gracilibacillus boraciitolerans JCM 21714]|uniref:Alfa-L-rhamnosidase n=1 Tax=Gracilibacillus boraciitolerans JCM 21714 TaxID=1298598 RepID=W4VKE1_9BACI|nr:family 78 glycoside hydrolase catalytic domain [Gracilibacillus boraciitolerans]GAE93239.1 alfa-L-rhamnosidase [Gracilibacillus boraciitolerans JCM 21714]
MLQVKDLRTEYRENPIGIDVIAPRISWKLTSDQRNVRQASYQIQVANNDIFRNILWDSGEVKTEDSNFIALKEVTLESRIRYYFRMKVSDNHSNYSDWSEVSYFEMGLLDKEDWVADWIAAPRQWNGEPAPQLVRTFHVDGEIKKARVYATALGLYELHLNGNRVGDDYFTPGWTSYQTRLQYQTYDVTDLLTNGENELLGLLGNGWYKGGNLGWEGKKDIFGNRLSLLAQLHIEMENGKEVVVTTDENWQASDSAIRMSEIYHGETYDARFKVEAKESVEIINHTKDILVAQENEPVRKIDMLEPVELMQTPKGETVIDFGQNMVGWVSFDIEGKAGQEVEIKHAEILDGDGNFYTANLRAAKQTNKYILSGNGKETFEPHFTFQGFRYIQLIGFNEDQMELKNFRGVVLHSDMELTGDFKCSDPLINQLQHNILWGIKR